MHVGDDDDDDYQACLELTRELLARGDDPEDLARANLACNRAIQLRTDDAEGWLLKCQLLSALGDDVAALAASEMAIRRAPHRAEVHYWRAAVLGDLGQYEDGLRALDRAFRALGGDDAWLLEDIYYEKATMLDAMGAREAALATYEAGLERCPGSAILRAGLEPLQRGRPSLKLLRGGAR
jgi:tetratricopeptide (TPR) repeat protein